MRAELERAKLPKITLKQWVVKGTGKNRRKYLERSLLRGSRTRWVRQSAADRFDQTDAEREARFHGGVPFKLVAPRRLVNVIPMLKEFICKHAAGSPAREALHWIHGVGELKGNYTEGDCFCHECATKTVEKLRKRYPKKAEEVNLCVDGGYGSEEDGPRECELCGVSLQHSLTNYGVEEEISHFLTYPPVLGSPSDWSAISLAVQDLPEDSPLWSLVCRWVHGARSTRSAKCLSEKAVSP